MTNLLKAPLVCLTLLLVLAAPSFAQHTYVTDINYGNGNIVKETSGNGAPTDACTGLLRYTQKDATAGQNIWECINSHMVQQGSSTTSSPATASTFGTVKLSPGQSSTTLSKVATTGLYSDLSGLPTIASYSDFVGSGTGHAHGLVPDPGASAGTTRYLREDGTWAVVPSGAGAVPGSTPDLYSWDGSQWVRATADQIQAKLSEDTVNNSQLGFHQGSGGDATCHAPTPGEDHLCFKGGIIQKSHDGGEYAPAFPWPCQPGLNGGGSPIPAGTSHQTVCRNDTGSVVTLTSIKCQADTGTSTCNVTNGAGAALLAGGTAITGTSTYASGTQSSTVTLAPGDFLKFTFVTDGTTTDLGADVTGVY